MTETVAMLSDLTLNAVRAESIRAHLKHHRPDEGSGSLFDGGLTILSRLAALVEEVGEVAKELIPDAVSTSGGQLAALVSRTEDLGEYARSLTYDHGGPKGLVGEANSSQHSDRVDRAKLVKELIQVANVALSWAQQIEDGPR